jgi:hypothetical protein
MWTLFQLLPLFWIVTVLRRDFVVSGLFKLNMAKSFICSQDTNNNVCTWPMIINIFITYWMGNLLVRCKLWYVYHVFSTTIITYALLCFIITIVYYNMKKVQMIERSKILFSMCLKPPIPMLEIELSQLPDL